MTKAKRNETAEVATVTSPCTLWKPRFARSSQPNAMQWVARLPPNRVGANKRENRKEGTEVLEEREFQRTVKDALAKIRDKDMRILQESNIEARESEAINAEAEGAYMCVLEELTARQREAVRRYMATQTAADNDQVDNAYIAGIRDGIRFMISFRLADNR